MLLIKNSCQVWLLWQVGVSIHLLWVELKNRIYCQAIADILTKLYRNVLWEVFYEPYVFFLPILLELHPFDKFLRLFSCKP